MRKTFKIIFGIISILVLGVLFLYVFTNEFEKKIEVLDCEGIYYGKLFENSKETFGYNNAKVDVADCLCEKYQQNGGKYSKEILKLYEDFDSEYKEKHPKSNVDSICKYKKDIFWKMYDY